MRWGVDSRWASIVIRALQIFYRLVLPGCLRTESGAVREGGILGGEVATRKLNVDRLCVNRLPIRHANFLVPAE